MSTSVNQFGSHILNAYKEEVEDGLSFRAMIHVNLSQEANSYALVEVFREGEWQECYWAKIAEMMGMAEEAGYKINTKWITEAIEDVLEEGMELASQQ